MVVYDGVARSDHSKDFVSKAIQAVRGVQPEWFTVHAYKPEDFLVVFAEREHHNRVSARPVLEYRVIKLFFRPWNRQVQTTHAILGTEVFL